MQLCNKFSQMNRKFHTLRQYILETIKIHIKLSRKLENLICATICKHQTCILWKLNYDVFNFVILTHC